MITDKKKKQLEAMLDNFQKTCQLPFRGDAERQERIDQKKAIVQFVEDMEVKPRRIETVIRFRPEMSAEDYLVRMQFFTMMILEADKWALSLHGTMQKELQMRMNRYRETANGMINFMKQSFDLDAMEDLGETFSKVMDMLRANNKQHREELFALMKAWSEDKIRFIDQPPLEKDEQEVEVDLGDRK